MLVGRCFFLPGSDVRLKMSNTKNKTTARNKAATIPRILLFRWADGALGVGMV